ncbi:MAG: IPT/TIG domain-containing protein, partial [Acidobacteria bacterium]|nr:IPT/TIG domain-containing protein [Acidobacteriota bacterium]
MLTVVFVFAGLAVAQTGNPVPAITAISPTSAAAGSSSLSLTVTGTGFNLASKVRWNGTDQSTTYVSATQLSAWISSTQLATAGTAQVTVYNPPTGGGTSNAIAFTITANPVPTITSISPSTAAAGSGTMSLTVTGTGFTAASKVRWNGTDASTTYTSSTQLSGIIWSDSLATAGTAQITVYNPGAGSSNAVTFTVAANPVPAITSISPATAAAGAGTMSLTVTGTGFTAASKVRWNGADVSTTTYTSSTQLTAWISSGSLAT